MQQTENNSFQKPELLCPAGGREQLESAVLYGADAVYLSGNELSLRAQCTGFANSDIPDAIAYAHKNNVRVYYCINALPYNSHLPTVQGQLEMLGATDVDGLIAADPGVIRMIGRICPHKEIHLSTQAHSSNKEAVAFWQDLGIHRINLARELDAGAMAELVSAFPHMEFEIFVHGAMCLSLSGHCLISAWANKRPANLGQCTQPCRFKYRSMALSVEEEMRPGEAFMEVREGEDFSSIWSPDDLCLVRYMPELLNIRPTALKIEGRTKSGSYVAQVTDAYRTAIDSALALSAKGESFASEGNRLAHELFHTATRTMSSGFFLPERTVEEKPAGFAKHPVVARLIEPLSASAWSIDVRSPWETCNDAELLLPNTARKRIKAGSYALENFKGEKTERVNPGTKAILHCDDTESFCYGRYIRVCYE